MSNSVNFCKLAYVRVPVEPTEAMIFAGCEALVGSIGSYEAG